MAHVAFLSLGTLKEYVGVCDHMPLSNPATWGVYGCAGLHIISKLGLYLGPVIS